MRRIVQGNAFMGAAVCHDMIRGTACVGIYDGNGDEEECEWWRAYSRLYFLPRYIHRLQGLCIDRPIHVFEYVSSLDKFLCSGSVLVPTYELLSRQVCGHAHVCSVGFGCSFVVVAIRHRSSIYYCAPFLFVAVRLADWQENLFSLVPTIFDLRVLWPGI